MGELFPKPIHLNPSLKPLPIKIIGKDLNASIRSATNTTNQWESRKLMNPSPLINTQCSSTKGSVPSRKYSGPMIVSNTNKQRKIDCNDEKEETAARVLRTNRQFEEVEHAITQLQQLVMRGKQQIQSNQRKQ